MPELPDLTVFAENLQRRLAGRKVQAVECPAAPRLGLEADELRRGVAGRRIEKVERWGKEIDLRFSGDVTLRIHLMLSGRFVFTENPDRLDDRVLALLFEKGPALAVIDPKGLARILLNPKPGGAPDALEADADYLRRRAAEKPRTLVKAFLIDQAVLRGIGNAYADEILWEARISPRAAVGKIPAGVIGRLAAAIRTVLTEATEKIRAANPEIIDGEIRDFLLIHNPQRVQSPTGHSIIKEKIASKTTYYTEEQIRY